MREDDPRLGDHPAYLLKLVPICWVIDRVHVEHIRVAAAVEGDLAMLAAMGVDRKARNLPRLQRFTTDVLRGVHANDLSRPSRSGS